VIRQRIASLKPGRIPLLHEAPDHGFTALSFNVGNGLAEPSRLTDYLGRSEADIVGIQELSLSQAEAIERDLTTVYPYRLVFPAGKGLLSRFPLRTGAVVAFAPDRPDLDAIVEVEHRKLHVIVAHPRPPKVSRSGVLFDEVTERQLREVGQLAMRERPAVILCDLNMTSLQRTYAELIGAGLVDPFRKAGRWGATFPRRIGHTHRVGERVDKLPLRPVIRIDYILHTPELKATGVALGEDAGSDHIPVLARLAWRDEARNAQ
jgi:endonuclease/exonuclease/phosphatase (EEP) superfamily protein YafD